LNDNSPTLVVGVAITSRRKWGTAIDLQPNYLSILPELKNHLTNAAALIHLANNSNNDGKIKDILLRVQ